MNVRLAPKSFEFNRKSHDEYSDSGMRSKKSKAPPCVKQYSALCAFLTHELISTKATQQIVLGSVPATTLPREQGKALRASICLTFGAKKNNHLAAFGAPQTSALRWKRLCEIRRGSQRESGGFCLAGSVLEAAGAQEGHPAWRSPGSAKLSRRMSQAGKQLKSDVLNCLHLRGATQ